ncbi:MAG TPA: peptidylprolyl isomerase [Mariprofundaceae bacterium]|nr:peptidylprolyl isomerase [Mariprofundaceae bacterium]
MRGYILKMIRNMVIGLMALVCNTQVVYAERLDAIAAVVNGDVITCFEVETEMQSLKDQLRQSGVPIPSGSALYERALDSRIQRTLQNHEAQTLGIRITPAEVDAAMADVEKRNNLQAGQLSEVLQAQGIDIETYRDTLKARILNGRLVNAVVRSKLSVSDEAKREYYRKHLKDPKPVREVRTSQMFVALPADADAEIVEQKRAEAEVYYQRFLAGENFLSTVTLESDAPNASEGGDMGWVSKGGVKGAFAQIFDVPVGGITPPIRSAGGFHIVKVMDERVRKPENIQPYEEVRARHILLQIPESADLDTQVKIRQRAEKIAEEMQNTSDEAFAVRAKELSQGPSATRGGDLGWFKRGQMVSAFDEVVFDMQPGETSGVVETQFGLHVIRLVEKRRVEPNAYEAHQERIGQLLLETEMQQEVPRWMNSLKSKAKIEKKSCDFKVDVQEKVAESPAKESDSLVIGQLTDTANADMYSAASHEDMAVEEDTSKPSFTLGVWKQAWQNKDLDVYLSLYDDKHSPDSRFSSFAKWKAYKTQVIGKHQNIRVEISNMIEEVITPELRVQFSFDQHFESDSMDDNDRKIIVMEKLEGTWKIVSERTVK